MGYSPGRQINKKQKLKEKPCLLHACAEGCICISVAAWAHFYSACHCQMLSSFIAMPKPFQIWHQAVSYVLRHVPISFSTLSTFWHRNMFLKNHLIFSSGCGTNHSHVVNMTLALILSMCTYMHVGHILSSY